MSESGIPPPPLPFYFPKQTRTTLAHDATAKYYDLMYPFSPPESYFWHNRQATLAEHLGYDSDTRLLIINADDFGLTPEINRAVIDLANRREITSTTLMVPAQSYREARDYCVANRSLNCGIHLTLTSASNQSPIQPVLPANQVLSLLNDSLRFYHSAEAFFANADPLEAEMEAAAQIDKALADGIDITHLDSHEGTLQLMPQFANVFLSLAVRYQLPVRMGSKALLLQLGLTTEWIDKCRHLGLHAPDNLVYLPIDRFHRFSEKQSFVLNLIDQLPAGVTELYFHPALPTATASKDSDDASYLEVRRWDYDILNSDVFTARLTSTS